MDIETALVGLATVLTLGFLARWIAWRLHLPSILLLLLTGLVAGPGTLFLNPDELFGNALLPFVSISVALILFEGGLSLSFRDLKGIGGVVRNLVTVGVVVTGVIASAGAYLILSLDLPLALLLGSILVVTGPTVIIPLLQHVRPASPLGHIVRWEGILNDPFGALLAVLVFEAILAGEMTSRADEAGIAFLSAVGFGVLVGAVGAGLMVLVLRFQWIPEFLDAYFSLTMVVAVLMVSNHYHAESGLIAVTVMGIVLANQRASHVKHIVEFNEHLRVLVISILFILLAARLKVDDIYSVTWREWVFLAVLIVAARPAAVAVATLGSGMTWQQKAFLSAMAPRGIVAAAVASVFAVRLEAAGVAGAERLTPVVFFVIIGTVTVYGLGAFPFAKRLDLAQPHPQGVLFVGAQLWACRIAKVLQDAGFRVVMADSNWANVTAARLQGLPTHFGSIFSRCVLEEVDLCGIGRLLAVTSNDEANSLASVHFAEIFGRHEVYQLFPEACGASERSAVFPLHLQGRRVFGPGASYQGLASRFRDGWTVKKTMLGKNFDYQAFLDQHGEGAIPLFVISSNGDLQPARAEDSFKPRSQQTIICLVPPASEEPPGTSEGVAAPHPQA